MNHFSSKSKASSFRSGLIHLVAHAHRARQPLATSACIIGLVCSLPLSGTAQTRLSSSQVRSEVSRLTANDQRQDLRLYSLEKDVDYLQKKGSYTPRSPSSFSAKSPVQTLPSATTYTVRPGDTVWRIAMNHRVSPGEIIQLNGLKSDTVNTGQILKIPAKGAIQSPPSVAVSTSAKTSSTPTLKTPPPSGATHTIRSGETFSQIAHQYGISQTSLKQANPQVNPNVIVVGGKLNLPSGTQATTKTPATTPVIAAPAATPPASGSQRHTVRAGDTLSSIAASYGVSSASIQRSNTLANPDRLSIGQTITIPSGTPKSQPAPTPTPSYPANTLANTPSPSPSPSPSPKVSPGPAPQANHRGVLSYRVHSTDTLESIASTFGTTPEKIRELNRKPAGSKVAPDEEILVPAMGAVSL